MTSINAIAGKNYFQTTEVNAAKEKVTFQNEANQRELRQEEAKIF